MATRRANCVGGPIADIRLRENSMEKPIPALSRQEHSLLGHPRLTVAKGNGPRGSKLIRPWLAPELGRVW